MLGPNAARVDAHDLAGRDLAQVVGADGRQRARLRCDHVAVVAIRSDAQRAHAPRIAERVDCVARAHHDRVRALRDAHRRHDLVGPGCAAGERDRLGEDLRIRGRAEPHVVGQQRRELVGVGQIAVVAEGKRAQLRLLDERLRVHDHRTARGRVAGVTDRHAAEHAAELFLVEDAGDQPHLTMAVDVAAVADREPGALLTAMLQRVEAEVGEPGDVFARCVDPGNPARLVKDVAGRLNRLLVVRPRHRSRCSRSGTPRPGERRKKRAQPLRELNSLSRARKMLIASR